MAKSIHRPEYAVLTALLRQAREQSGMHQTEAAAALGRSQSFLSDVERGARRLDIIELWDLCEILGLDFPSLATRVDEEIRKLNSSRAAKRRGAQPKRAAPKR